MRSLPAKSQLLERKLLTFAKITFCLSLRFLTKGCSIFSIFVCKYKFSCKNSLNTSATSSWLFHSGLIILILTTKQAFLCKSSLQTLCQNDCQLITQTSETLSQYAVSNPQGTRQTHVSAESSRPCVAVDICTWRARPDLKSGFCTSAVPESTLASQKHIDHDWTYMGNVLK